MNKQRNHYVPASVLKAKALPDQRRLMRTVGWLVGAALLVGSLTIGLRAQAATSSAASCTPATCGKVTSVTARQVKGQGSGVGVVGGAVLGGLVGNQLGKGTGNTVLTVGGAVAGGFAGNEVEKNIKKHTVYRTSVRMGDGTVHEYTLNTQYATGAKVSVINGRVRARD
ncbi:glycine zipper 2TM domain-containing protein [Aquabacterium sp.]|uniref:glycine zipper 2TM domain-containing protein n=1 Tax=Aquabacterium sp. TaxID=1872578 RepID=UPI0024885585|nr:glycine zipper 2TM domain-containing protein [Aquabacterium sp.]MDI1259918.1 glycine zipper 2TM domain-containing protein [Aquabacterium sp.]